MSVGGITVVSVMRSAAIAPAADGYAGVPGARCEPVRLAPAEAEQPGPERPRQERPGQERPGPERLRPGRTGLKLAELERPGPEQLGPERLGPGLAGLKLAELEFAVIDLETTGWSPEAAAITEIAAVRVRGGVRRGEFASLVNSGVPVPPKIEDLTGISDWMLAAAPGIPAVLPGLLAFAEGWMAAISTNATPPSNGFSINMEILGKPSGSEQQVRFNLVSQEYFPALHIAIAQGRVWDATENHNAAPVTVINETLAKKYFPAGDAIGHSIKFPDIKDAPPYNVLSPQGNQSLLIVGIIKDKLDDGLAKPVLPEVFVPYTYGLRMGTQILVRSSSGSPLALLHAVSAKVNAIDHDQQTNSGTEDLEHWISDEPEWATGRMLTWLFGAFAVLALVMSAVGLYSVVSYLVVQRTNEFGIRMALGARKTHVLGIVFSSVLASVGGGMIAGIALSVGLSRILSHWDTAKQVSIGNPMLLGASALMLVLVAAVACMIPARRAAAVSPMTAIRYE